MRTAPASSTAGESNRSHNVKVLPAVREESIKYDRDVIMDADPVSLTVEDDPFVIDMASLKSGA